jgi:hypothetical protein
VALPVKQDYAENVKTNSTFFAKAKMWINGLSARAFTAKLFAAVIDSVQL